MASIDDQGRAIAKKVPLDGIRKVISDKMTCSITEFPQGTSFVRADVSKLIQFRNELKEKDIKITFGDMYVKAVACALTQNMQLNAARIEEELMYYESINVGMMATINGYLMEPIVRDANLKTVEEISAELAEAYENLKNRKMMRVNLEGATFSVSNLGMYDVDGFTPLLMPPEGGIIGVGSVRKLAVFDENDNMSVVPHTTLSVTTDHGLVDGIDVVKFIQSLKAILMDPWEWMYKKASV